MSNAPHVLVVEDEDTDVELMRHAFERLSLPIHMQVARDGQEAVEYLTKCSGSSNAPFPLPSLVLLDLKMPRLDGFQVLAWRLQQPTLKDVPFIVLTSSSYDSDRDRARELGASDFLVKPSSFLNLISMLGSLTTRWLIKS